jgi:hypothetical protein
MQDMKNNPHLYTSAEGFRDPAWGRIEDRNISFFYASGYDGHILRSHHASLHHADNYVHSDEMVSNQGVSVRFRRG